MHTKTLLAAAATSVLATTSAHAYEMTSASQPSNTLTVYLDPWVQILMPNHYDKLQTAAAKVNGNASAMRFYLASDDDVSRSLGNGESEAEFTSNAATICNSLACTIRMTSGGDITEADVYFELDYDWTLTDSKYDSKAYDAGEERPLVNTAIHEFAHTLGVKHEGDVFQIMGNAWNVVSTNGDHTETVISEDTTAGLVSVYGPSATAVEDLSLYHWRHLGSSGDYSTHARTRLSDPGGAPMALLVGAFEPVYRIGAGTSVLVEQTAENRGSNSQEVMIRWYVSTDSTITDADTLLTSSSIELFADTPFTWSRQVTLPSNLTSGARYWVGAIIDDDDELTENNELNNAIYVAEMQII
jgi:hypothetical protein